MFGGQLMVEMWSYWLVCGGNVVVERGAWVVYKWNFGGYDFFLQKFSKWAVVVVEKSI
jgi:hypothetical protein